jgi:DNA ligase-1
MRAFAGLYAALDASTSTRAKVDTLSAYLQAAAAQDAAWAVYFLSGGKPRQLVPTRLLRALACERAGIADWLFEECYQAVGDLAETIAHLLPPAARDSDLPLSEWVENRLLPLRGLPEPELRARLLACWDELDGAGRLVWNKLITGSFRVGVSRQLTVKAIAQAHGADAQAVALRMMGDWQPSAAAYRALVEAAPPAGGESGQPYPFQLAAPLDAGVEALGERTRWQAEWKWDGIRAQLVRRGAGTWLWSRGEEVVTDRFPEVTQAARALPPGTVLDGELLAWADGQALPFAALQKRIGRTSVSAALLAQVPVRFLAYDVLERDGADLRGATLAARRSALEALLADATGALGLSPVLSAPTWDALAAERSRARGRGVEGLMLKRRDASYQQGRTRGDWWKWKVDPYTVDAVLVYAQRGHGRRAGLYTDYTFAVWHDGVLVPFAKAYSGLSDAEFGAVDRFIRQNTQEKFGPVRSVKPELVCEIGFEAIQASPRHKSGVAVRFPRILRLRADKRIEQADTLAALRALLP